MTSSDRPLLEFDCMPATTGLAVRQLCAWYETANGECRAIFWGVSFDVGPGEILGVAGPNGAGKSTLMRCIMGLHPYRTGEVKMNGQAITTQKIGMVPQLYGESFFAWASLRRNIEMVGGVSPERIEQTMDKFGITLNLSLRPPQCSGGMIQQAAILRAVSGSPALVIADEPFSSLDMHIAHSVRRGIRQHVQDQSIPVVVVSHDLLSLVELCDKILVIPGSPYTSAIIPGYEVATIIENETLESPLGSTLSDDVQAPSIVEAVSKLLRRSLG